MTNSTIQQNLVPNDPELKDLLNLFKKDILLNFNCHHVAKIQMFNPVNQTATATVNYKKTFFETDALGNYVPKLVDYPFLADCPVISLGGGNGVLTFPITSGDDCIVFFNDRDIDNWFSGSSSSANATPRLHSYSDGIILVGLRALNSVVINYSDDIELRTLDGLTKVAIASDGSKITAKVGPTMSLELDATGKLKITNGVTEFVSALDQLFKDIQGGLVTTLLGPQPLVMPTFAVDLLLLETFKS